MPKSLRALRYASVVLVAAVLFPVLRGTLRGAIASARAAESSADSAPTALTCESMEQPLGIDFTQSRLSWRVNDSRRGALQTAYEIRVASSLEKLAQGHADVWDSGKVESSESVNVAYGGPSVASRRPLLLAGARVGCGRQASALQHAELVGDGIVVGGRLESAMDHARLARRTRRLRIASKMDLGGQRKSALSKASVGKRDFRFSFDLAQKAEERPCC